MTNVSHITKFLKLKDDWDSYNAKAITKEAVEAALEFVLSNNGVGVGPTILPEDWTAVPGNDGSVQLEYYAGEFSAVVWFSPIGDRETTITTRSLKVRSIPVPTATNLQLKNPRPRSRFQKVIDWILS